MKRLVGEKVSFAVLLFENAPCHSCQYRGKYGADSDFCEKYPTPRYSIGASGKPDGILQGTKPCKFYKKDVS